jgi:PleD family two-component response regulator
MILVGDHPEYPIDYHPELLPEIEGLHLVSDSLSLLEEAISSAPQLIILNVDFWGEKAYKLCIQIKKNIRIKEIPLILINVPNEPTEKARGFQAGANDVISKPFIHIELAKRIQQQLLNNQYRQIQDAQTKAANSNLKCNS